MPRPKGLPKTGGRVKGSKNKVQRPGRVPITATQRAVNRAVRDAIALNMTPLQYMLDVLRDPTVDPRRRDAMAACAAPYCHPKLLAAQIETVTPESRLPSEEYASWAREQIRRAFDLPPLTIEHKATDVIAAPLSDNIVPLNPTPPAKAADVPRPLVDSRGYGIGSPNYKPDPAPDK